MLLRSPKRSPSRRSTSGHRVSDVEGDESTADDSTTGNHAGRKGEKDEISEPEDEDESEENAAVDELLEKYTTISQ